MLSRHSRVGLLDHLANTSKALSVEQGSSHGRHWHLFAQVDDVETVPANLSFQLILRHFSAISHPGFSMEISVLERRRLLRRIRELDRSRRHVEALELYQSLFDGKDVCDDAKAA